MHRSGPGPTAAKNLLRTTDLTVGVAHCHLLLCADGGLVQRRDLVKCRVDLEEDFSGLLNLPLDLLPLREQSPHLQLIWRVDELILEENFELDLLTAKSSFFLQFMLFDVLTHHVRQSRERQLDRLLRKQGLLTAVAKDFELKNFLKFVDHYLRPAIIFQIK